MLDKLYENIGKKIKTWAKWIFIVEAISAIVTGFVFLIDIGFEYGWWSLFIIIFGPIVAFISTWILYAYGQIADDLHAMREKEVPEQEEKKQEKEPARKIERSFEDSKKEPAPSLFTCGFCNKQFEKLETYKSFSPLINKEVEYQICEKCAKKHNFI